MDKNLHTGIFILLFLTYYCAITWIDLFSLATAGEHNRADVTVLSINVIDVRNTVVNLTLGL